MTQEQQYKIINHLLRCSDVAVGAYCLGFATVALKCGLVVSEGQMNALTLCRTVSDGEDLARLWWGADFFAQQRTTDHCEALLRNAEDEA